MIQRRTVERALDELLNDEPYLMSQLLSDAGVRETARGVDNVRSLISEIADVPLFTDVFEKVLKKLGKSPHSDQVVNGFERFVKASVFSHELFEVFNAYPFSLDLVISICLSSRYLTDVLVRNPEFFNWLIGEDVLGKDKTKEKYDEEIRQVLEVFKVAESERRALCRYKRREMLRIGARDLLSLASVQRSAAELSFLADTIIQYSLDVCRQESTRQMGTPRVIDATTGKAHDAAFSIIAMGKLGAGELNFSSDIDVLFVYEDEGNTVPPAGGKSVTNHEFFSKLAGNLVLFLSSHEPDGCLYRVDTRLRPEGLYGPIARSIESYSIYFPTQARIWEKVAYVRARHSAGDRELGNRFEQIAHDFAFTHVPGDSLKREMKRLRNRIDKEILSGKEALYDVKRGTGGIREIEFIVALFQLTAGGMHKEITSTSTFNTLALLPKVNLLSPLEADALAGAYSFLRTLEHRLQMRAERQVHTIPESYRERCTLAYSLGLASDVESDPAVALERAYLEHTRFVNTLFNKIFSLPDEPAKSTHLQDLLVSIEGNEEEALRLLRPYRLADSTALGAIERLLKGSKERYVSAEGQRLFESFIPGLLSQASKTPFPQKALSHLDSFLRVEGGITPYYALIKQSPNMLKLLLTLFGTSDFLSRVLIAHPEYFELLISSETFSPPECYRAYLDSLAERITQPSDRQEAFSRLRTQKQLEILKIGLWDLLGICTQDEIHAALTDLARWCLELGVTLSLPAIESRERDRIRAHMSILAMGTFGAAELSYFSDLDTVFIYHDSEHGTEGGEKSLHTVYTNIAKELSRTFSAITPEGSLFKLDFRLRPEGEGAPLVIHENYYRDYFTRGAQVWEYQSFLKASHAAGNVELSNMICSGVRAIILKRIPELDIREVMLGMSERIHRNVSMPSWGSLDYKRSPGGLFDIEFIVQYLQLTQAVEFPALLEITDMSTLVSLLVQRKAMLPEDAESLRSARAFLMYLESRNRILFETAKDIFPQSRARLEPLEIAMKAHLPSETSLKEHLETTMGTISALFGRYVGAA